METKIKLEVNTQAIPEAMRNSFTNEFTVISELMQNASRAGATKLLIQDHENGDVSFTDNGFGISDFQSLVTIAGSKWSDEVTKKESPYGVGFMAAIFGSKEVIVSSGTRSVHIVTAELLKGEPVKILRCNPIRGTIVRMVRLDARKNAKFIGEVRARAKGMGIKISYKTSDSDVHVLPNPHAIKNDESKGTWIPTAHGDIFFPKNEAGFYGTLSSDAVLYLAGSPIRASQNTANTYLRLGRFIPSNVRRTNIIMHLNPQKYFGQMPDRQVLLDSTNQQVAIIEIITQTLFEVIKSERERLKDSPEVFIQHYWNLCMSVSVGYHQGFREILNEMDYVPSELFQQYSDLPLSTDYDSGNTITDYFDGEDAPKVIHKDSLPDKFILMDPMFHTVPIEESFGSVPYQLAYEAELPVVQCDALPTKHWLYEHGVTHTSMIESLEITYSKEEAPEIASTNMEAIEVILCESVTASSHGMSATFKTVPLTFRDTEGRVILFVPTKCPSDLSEFVYLISDYTDEHGDFLEYLFEEDTKTLRSFIEDLRGAAPLELLTSLLTPLKLGDYKSLADKEFTVSIRSGKMDIELMENS